MLLLGFDVVVWGAGPVGPELDEFVVEVHANSVAHTDDHRLAVHCFQSSLEVLDHVFRDQILLRRSSPNTAHVLASLLSIGVPVKPMNEVFRQGVAHVASQLIGDVWIVRVLVWLAI